MEKLDKKNHSKSNASTTKLEKKDETNEAVDNSIAHKTVFSVSLSALGASFFFAASPLNMTVFSIMDFDMIFAESASTLLDGTKTAQNTKRVILLITTCEVGLFATIIHFADLSWNNVKHCDRWVSSKLTPVS